MDISQKQKFILWYRNQKKNEDIIKIFDRGEFHTVHGVGAIELATNYFQSKSSLLHWNSSIDNYSLETCKINKNNYERTVKYLLFDRNVSVEILQNISNEWKVVKSASPGNYDGFNEELFQVESSMNDDLSISSGIMSIYIDKNSNDSNRLLIGCCFTKQSQIIINQLSIRISVINENNKELNRYMEFNELRVFITQMSPREIIWFVNEKYNIILNPFKQSLNDCSRDDILIHNFKEKLEMKKNVEESSNILDQFISLCEEEDRFKLIQLKLEENYMMSLKGFQLINYQYPSLFHINQSEKMERNIWKISIHNNRNLMMVDRNTLQALNVFPKKMNNSTIKSINDDNNLEEKFSLYSLLTNKCISKQGKYLLGEWLRQPLTNVKELEKRQKIIEYFLTSINLIKSIEFSSAFASVNDLQQLLYRLSKKRMNINHLYRLWKIVENQMFTLQQFKLDDNRNDDFNQLILNPLTAIIRTLERFVQMINDVIDSSSMKDPVINPQIDDRMKKIVLDVRDFESEIQRISEEMIKKYLSDVKVGIEKNSLNSAYLLKITKKDEKSIRNEKLIDVMDTKKEKILFQFHSMRSINEKLIEARREYEEYVSMKLQDINHITLTYYDSFQQLIQLTGLIDVFISIAQFIDCAPIPFVAPTLIPLPPNANEERIRFNNLKESFERNDLGGISNGKYEDEFERRIISLKNSRHVCLERMTELEFIPNHIYLSSGIVKKSKMDGIPLEKEKDKNEDERTLIIITGPNMGGKSTYLRQTALSVLLAQIGCYVPAQSAIISICDSILIRIGAADCQSKGISTFMAEMLDCATICQSSSKYSLILIDELGRGTSTYDGLGLAWGLSEYLAKLKVFTMFATHFHEIGHLAQVTCMENGREVLMYKQVANLHAEAEVLTIHNENEPTKLANEQLVLLYTLADGICKRSYGLNVAKMVNMPNEVIDVSNKHEKEMDELSSLFHSVDEHSRNALKAFMENFLKFDGNSSHDQFHSLLNKHIPNDQLKQQILNSISNRRV